jgi:hypothetical protein
VDAEVKLRADALEWREVEGEIVALDLESATYFSVNPSGAAMWPALVDGTTREQLVARLVDTFDIDEATAARDVESFLTALAERRVLEPVSHEDDSSEAPR